ncbi:hypothetical protein OCK74_23695 [Chitinophagaceae bacterium LB-8]|uniref:site-specific DNA-methyltransferase (adenine-specific) n=1 Tax=Paraflavisolibacter caeni TaxID=2982496 RepID=A0A9X3BK38_9BACT|nr:DNA methyltransferase [Paraflavisolibacter caeni]MCU7552143.1 hypothetical protein [Paraflavisolibacter caeni]
MPLSWSEIKRRAQDFSYDWRQKKTKANKVKNFFPEFLNVFGISRRRVASFECAAQELFSKVESPGNITTNSSLLWKGVILINFESNLTDENFSFKSRIDVLSKLPEKERPRFILASDFVNFCLLDLGNGVRVDFSLTKFVDHVQLFGLLAGYQVRPFKELDPVNIEAAELMGGLHDKLKDLGYAGHPLEVFLIRLVFILFADNTNIFEKGIFLDYIQSCTAEDGSDLAQYFMQLFQVLNTPKDSRSITLDETLQAFPYINGKLFDERFSYSSFDTEVRQMIIDCCLLDWGRISPAIFGSLFQSVMDEKARRNLGAHYTSEKNILKLIKPLFLDKLWQEFESIKTSRTKLLQFHNKISNLRFLDPACGCGNFLIIAYREVRLLEIAIIKELLFRHMKLREEVAASAGIDISVLLKCHVDRYYGIEYEEFPCQIAQVAMWLMDHQMNMQASQIFGCYYVRLPLRKSAHIRHGNALRFDWQRMLVESSNETSAERFDYIFGNPPFVGKQLQNAFQKEDMDLVFAGINGAGVLDYVTAWYIKAAQYMQEYSDHPAGGVKENKTRTYKTKTAFVSTNSIAQGEQVGILWNELFGKYAIKIHFAHRTFKWSNEARGNAAVHVVIIGFANFNVSGKLIYDYEDIKGEALETVVKNVNPYLVEGKDQFIVARAYPICNVSKMYKGSQPTDGGYLLFTDDEKTNFIHQESGAIPYIKPFISAHEFINGEKRWCLWLADATQEELHHLPHVMARIEGVRSVRLKSSKQATVKWAKFPTLFTENRQPDGDYVLIPSHSSENRKYIPIGFMSKDDILNNSCFAVPNATLYEFGILTSEMHTVWVKNTCGRIKSDFRYSNTLNYNNFPWPKGPNEKQIKGVEEAAKEVLNARSHFQKSSIDGQYQREASLADLYHPNSMPQPLLKAHEALDRAVDFCYRLQPFTSETNRMAFLFELHEKYTKKERVVNEEHL